VKNSKNCKKFKNFKKIQKFQKNQKNFKKLKILNYIKSRNRFKHLNRSTRIHDNINNRKHNHINSHNIQTHYKRIKPFIISLADTISQPRAMMIEFLNAIITISTMSGSKRSDNKASLADPIPSNKACLDYFKLSFLNRDGFYKDSAGDNPGIGESG
jgi:hypothetical protein